MTTNYSKYSLRNVVKAIVNTGLAAIVAGSVLAGSFSGCATPNCIKERRYLGAQGKLNNSTYTQVSVDDRNSMVKAGISLDFNNLKELKEEAASAVTALGYGVIRPVFREFWSSNKPDQYEFNGLAPFTASGYRDGRKAETIGELLRYIAIIYGASQALDGGSSGSESTSSGPITTTTTTTTTGRTRPTLPITSTTTIPPTTTTTQPPANPPTGPQGGDIGGGNVGY